MKCNDVKVFAEKIGSCDVICNKELNISEKFWNACPLGDEKGVDAKEHAQKLLIIKVPYRKGQHCTTHLSDFTPIIDQLHFLHTNGYVHGDIRAFNTVFYGKISFYRLGFGRLIGRVYFPEGYMF